MGAMLMKIVILLKENESRMAKNFLSRNDPILSTQRICQINDLVKNLMGAMHQKIAIFKVENSVWWGPKFSNVTKWHYFLDELNLKFPKIEGGDVDENRHFIEGKLVAHGQKFSILKILITKWQYFFRTLRNFENHTIFFSYETFSCKK